MTMRSYSRTLTTDASGDATDYTPSIAGRLMAIHYIKNGTTPYNNGVDFTITNETTGLTIWAQLNVNVSTSVYPRVATHNSDGTPALYASGGLGVLDYFALARHRIKIVVANGGNTKDGSFLFVIDG